MRLLWVIIIMIIIPDMMVSCDTRVVEFDIERSGEKSFEIQPNQVSFENHDFTICLRCKFWTWNTKIIFQNQKMFLGIRNFEAATGHIFYNGSSIFKFSTIGLKVSSTLWNSICLIYNSSISSLTIAINERVQSTSGNLTKLDSGSVLSKITVGSTFLGQITDFNIWSQALNQTLVDAYIQCSNELLER